MHRQPRARGLGADGRRIHRLERSFVDEALWSTDYGDTGSWNKSPSYWSTIRFPDLDGEGRADICGRGIAGLACALSRP